MQSEESACNARACGAGGRELASAAARTYGQLKRIFPDAADSIRAYRCFRFVIFFLRLISCHVAALFGCTRATSFSILSLVVSSFHFLHVSLRSLARMAFPFYTRSVLAYPRSRSPSHSGGHRHHLHACLLHHRGRACVCLVFSVLFHK